MDAAIDQLRETLAQRPDDVDARSGLVGALVNAGRPDEAIPHYEQSAAAAPADIRPRVSLAVALMMCERFTEAEAALLAVCQWQAPRDVLALVYDSLGMCAMMRRDAPPELAISRFAAARAHGSKSDWLAVFLLSIGRLTDGWRHVGMPNFSAAALREMLSQTRGFFVRPLWDGSPQPGKTLYVWNPGGYGDAFFYARYFPMVKAAFRGTVVFGEDQKLAGLFSRVAGIDRFAPFFGREIAPEDIDLQIALSSVPGLFRTTIETIPAAQCIAADPALVATWGNVLSNTTGFRVGICWREGEKHPGTMHRSAPLRLFAPLAAVPGVTLVSLQHGPGVRELPAAGFPVIAPDAIVQRPLSFDDLAALIRNVDLTISVDTSVANLAGAMGTQVWALLRQMPDWRWMRDGERTPWFPSARLFRCGLANSFDRPLFEFVARELAAHIRDAAPKR